MEDTEWCTANQALRLLDPSLKPSVAMASIINRAKGGLIIAKAQLFRHPARLQNRTRGEIEERDCEIPREFWTGQDKGSNWATGDFTRLIEDRYQARRCHAYGVQFDRAGIDALMPGTAAPLASAPVNVASASDVASQPDTQRRNEGGRPPSYDWERAVAAVVFQWADEGSWQPASQADVKNKIAEYFSEKGECPSDSMLKTRARWLFEEFQRRNGEVDNLAT